MILAKTATLMDWNLFLLTVRPAPAPCHGPRQSGRGCNFKSFYLLTLGLFDPARPSP